MASAATTAEIPEAEPEAEPVARKPSSVFAFIAVMLILTGLGIGLGGLTGLQLLSRMEAATSSKGDARSGQGGGQALKGRYSASANLRSLPPIVTNLASPGRTWIRLEASLVVDGDQTAEVNVLVAQITEDIIAFLRTVTLVQIQGASGFQHLREDLSDRVRVRSGGKIRDLVIQSMIIE
jgi:flagellar protein FliL